MKDLLVLVVIRRLQPSRPFMESLRSHQYHPKASVRTEARYHEPMMRGGTPNAQSCAKTLVILMPSLQLCACYPQIALKDGKALDTNRRRDSWRTCSCNSITIPQIHQLKVQPLSFYHMSRSQSIRVDVIDVVRMEDTWFLTC